MGYKNRESVTCSGRNGKTKVEVIGARGDGLPERTKSPSFVMMESVPGHGPLIQGGLTIKEEAVDERE